LNKTITILGSTGSIGTQALVVASMLDLKVHALSAGKNTDLLYEQAVKYRPKYAVIADPDAYKRFKSYGLQGTEILYGEEGLLEVCRSDAGLVLNAIVGIAGLRPTLEAINSGADLALANKESIVTFGGQIMRSAAEKGISIIPVDSEHSAVFQCLSGEKPENVKNIILTASGGPFIDKKPDELANVTVDQTLAHPNWKMGKKISVDSATMMNKGLEVIEARYLFNVKKENIKVIIQRESLIHSLVEFADCSYKAQLGYPDMKIPIAYAMTYPERYPVETVSLDFGMIGAIHFEDVDHKKFPCLGLAYRSLSYRNSMNVVLNAANEVSVDAFLDRRIGFTDIAHIIEKIMGDHMDRTLDTCDDVFDTDNEIRIKTREYIGGHGCR
jgi:1-deoxy-D-xylulose-5-phosphate reductoisomerase